MTVDKTASGESRKRRLRSGRRLRPLAALQLLLVLLLALLVPAACSRAGPSAESDGGAGPDLFTAVAWVNGEPVAYGEFRTRMLELRGEVIAETAKGGADPAAKGFWTSGAGGRTPLDC
ncbi:hypothetical protein [Paenibacillus sabinae]|uniref:Uncharacterized protein n=1 Tax=Paenibacillus sabinae T27 TaxID=1268072 RepID=X4ZG59_9BACL|nr:hypothetical protein [Paenibacillus sabinae]AHV96382.1 hypothetical protein PSAB_07240 [Paenibacillus sabinae T27]